MQYRCMAVDDDPVSRKIVKHFISQTNFLTLAYECETAIDAANILAEDDVDILFLDINMPEMSGMDLVQHLDDHYEVIMVTSNTDFAIEAFEKSVTDYLVKPLEYGRFLQASHKAKTNIESLRQGSEKYNDIFVRSDSKLVRVCLDEIMYIEALADYVIIHTFNQKYIVHSTMKGLAMRLPPSSFSRVHRSFIVNHHRIDSMEDVNISIADRTIPVGASYKDNFLSKLNLL